MSNEWIPCSVVEHPEHCRVCEVTRIGVLHSYVRDFAFYTDKWIGLEDGKEIEVIAWKEPSEPYNPKKGGEQK